MIEIYTDGAASGNPGPGGYGAILRSGKHYKELSGGFRLTTNNRMELLAVIVALKVWVQKGFKDKKNKDLWLQYLQQHKIHNVKFKWIKGHNEHPENERCDRLAVAASQNKASWVIDAPFEAERNSSSKLL
ncbi:Ribonuclease HI [compost metagenome]